MATERTARRKNELMNGRAVVPRRLPRAPMHMNRFSNNPHIVSAIARSCLFVYFNGVPTYLWSSYCSRFVKWIRRESSGYCLWADDVVRKEFSWSWDGISDRRWTRHRDERRAVIIFFFHFWAGWTRTLQAERHLALNSGNVRLLFNY